MMQSLTLMMYVVSKTATMLRFLAQPVSNRPVSSRDGLTLINTQTWIFSCELIIKHLKNQPNKSDNQSKNPNEGIQLISTPLTLPKPPFFLGFCALPVIKCTDAKTPPHSGHIQMKSTLGSCITFSIVLDIVTFRCFQKHSRLHACTQTFAAVRCLSMWWFSREVTCKVSAVTQAAEFGICPVSPHIFFFF